VWNHIPKKDLDAFISSYGVWYTIYAASLKNRSPVETVARNEAKKKAVDEVRNFVNQYLKFPPVTNEERTAMGIPVRDVIRTPLGEPTEMVDFSFRLKTFRQQEIHFKVVGADSKAKPYGSNGAAISWVAADKAVTSVEELTRHDLATRTPYVMHFTDEERGKVVSVAMQWVNRKSQKGPWSQIQTAIVP
jgi:hypothetical protein